MRESLKQSLADTPAQGFERYPRGSIVVCNSCARPLFRLDRGIDLGMGAGKCASAFKPVTVADLETLAQREDIDAGVRTMVREWTPAQRRAHVAHLWEPRPGEPMLCPCCLKAFVQVLSVGRHETLDRAYVVELLTITPAGTPSAPLRGKRIGTRYAWPHEGAKLTD